MIFWNRIGGKEIVALPSCDKTHGREFGKLELSPPDRKTTVKVDTVKR